MASDDGLAAAHIEVQGRAIGRWENEGGRADGWSHPKDRPTVAGEIGDAEVANIRVRLIALENILVALLAQGPESQSEMVRQMATYILPRPGMTPHRLTIEAAHNMLALVERAAQYGISPVMTASEGG